MHALIAHATRFARLPLHVVFIAGWRPLLAALALPLAGRALKLDATLGAALGIAAGWLLLCLPNVAHFPPGIETRVVGLGILTLCIAWLRQRGATGWWWLPVTAAAGAWWMRGAPLNGPGIVNTMPVFLGLLAGLAASRRLVRTADGAGLLSGSLAMAGALAVAGAPLLWVKAALVAAVATLPLLAQPACGETLAIALSLLAGLVVCATDRGRLTPIDFACAAPLAVWAASPALKRALARSGSVAASVLAATACIVLAWIMAHGGR